MNKNFPIILEQRESLFYCSIPELKLVFKSENLNEAYEGIKSLKEERLKSYLEFENSHINLPTTDENSIVRFVKNSIIVLFFLLLTIGVGTHLVSALVETISRKVEHAKEQLDIRRSLKAFESLSPSEKDEKIQAFKGKIGKAQIILKEAKPFIDASKPLLRDLQDSLNLKNPRP